MKHTAATEQSDAELPYPDTPSFGSFDSESAQKAASAPPAEAFAWHSIPPNPPPPPAVDWNSTHAASLTAGFAVAQSLQAAAAAIFPADRLPDGDGKSIRIENLHVHIHNPCPAVAAGLHEEYQKHAMAPYPRSAVWPFAPAAIGGSSSGHSCSISSLSEPSFAVTSSAEGIDFGRKVGKGFYRAVKHVDEHRNLITYTQSPSTMQTISLAVTLGLSTKRAKHVIFLFDSGPPQYLAHAWPLHIHLRDITSLIKSLGSSFEYTRSKVKKHRFSLYIFAIKQRNVGFSRQGLETWAALSSWAHNLPDSADNGMLSSFLSSIGTSYQQVPRF